MENLKEPSDSLKELRGSAASEGRSGSGTGVAGVSALVDINCIHACERKGENKSRLGPEVVATLLEKLSQEFRRTFAGISPEF
jgi:hypothetical protein